MIKLFSVLFILLLCNFKIVAANIFNSNLQQSQSFFIENKGQWDDRVLFLARTSGLNYWITRDGIVCDFYQLINPVKRNNEPSNTDLFEENAGINGHIVKSSFQRNNTTSFTGIDKQSAYLNYFIGNNSTNWVNNVPVYGEVYAKNIYQGIDARFYFDNSHIRYDLLVSPYADISQIRFNFEGQDGISVNDKGELEFQTSIGKVQHNNIFAYQVINNARKQLKCAFNLLNENTAGFEIEGYNPEYALIIDPVVYSTFIGGSNIDHGYDLEVDGSGFVYVAGATLSSNFPKTTGAYSTTLSATSDIFVSKLNTTGSALIFSTFIGGNNAAGGTYYEGAISILLDVGNNILISGATNSTNFPTTSGVYQTSYGGGVSDGFVIKLNSSGSALTFSTLLGGSSEERIVSEAWDASGNIFVVGAVGINSSNYPVTSGAFQTTYQGGMYDGFLTKLNSNATSLIFSTFIGGSLYDICRGIVIDAAGNSYINGCAYSSNFPTTAGAFRSSFCGGTQDAFVIKINSTGTSAIYSTYLGGNGIDYGHGITIDNNGNAYVIGYTSSSNFPVKAGNYKTTFQGGTYDGYMCKLNSSGSALLFSSFLGGSGDDTPYKIRLNSDSSILITGWTSSTNFPLANCPMQTSYGGGLSDGFITKVNPSFTSLLYSTLLGGSGEDRSSAIKTYTGNNVFITGYSGSSNYPVTAGAFQTTYGGSSYDAVVTKILIDTLSLITGNLNPVVLCPGSSISVPFTVTCPFNTGNVFTAQLSDSTGSFNSPINIGNVSGTNSDTIKASIPVYTPYGTRYRIRVIASNSSFTGTNNGVNLTVSARPKANFIVSDTTQCINGNNFIFNNTSTIANGTMTYLWNFADSTTSTLSNPSHTYSKAVTFKVKLVVKSDKFCLDSVMKNVYVYPLPISNFSINDSDQCLNENNFIFTNTSTSSSGLMFYLWDFGDNSTSTVKTPFYNYSTIGTYTIKLIAYSDNNCADSIFKKVYIYPVPVSGFTINDTDQCLNGNNFIFSNTSSISTGTLTSLWNLGDTSTSTLTNPSHSYSTPGDYNVRLVVYSNHLCKDSIMKKVHILPQPDPDFDINDSIQCLKNNNFIFTNNSTISGGSLSFKWYFGNNDSSTSINPIYKSNILGQYFVKLIAISDKGCTDSIIKTILILKEPTADFLINDTLQCFGNNLFQLTNLTDTSYTIFNWNFGDSHTSTDIHPSYTYTKAGLFKIRLIANLQNNCYDSVSKNVTIIPGPKAIFSINDTDQCLDQNNFIFTNTSDTTIGNVNFKWIYSDGIIDNNSNTHRKFSSAGKYTVKLIAGSDTSCSDSIIKSFQILPNSVAKFSFDSNKCTSDIIFNSESELAKFLLWDFGDGTTETDSVIVHTYKDTGKYLVTLFANRSQGCADSTSSFIEVFQSISKIYIPNIFTPNEDGLNDIFRLYGLKYECTKYNMLIYNCWGQILYESRLQNKIDEPYWNGYYKGIKVSPGVYIYIILGEKFTKAGSVIVLY